MPDFIRSQKIMKTRKEHRCFVCGELIHKGSPAVEWVSVDGKIFSSHCHEKCWEIAEGICFPCGECGEYGYQEGYLKECINCGYECNAVAAFNGSK